MNRVYTQHGAYTRFLTSPEVKAEQVARFFGQPIILKPEGKREPRPDPIVCEHKGDHVLYQTGERFCIDCGRTLRRLQTTE